MKGRTQVINMKNKIQWTTLIIFMSIALIFTYTTNNKVTGVMEQQQSKIEALQEENSMLHDTVWNLNNQLMKMGAEKASKH